MAVAEVECGWQYKTFFLSHVRMHARTHKISNQVATSEVIPHNLNPMWPGVTLNLKIGPDVLVQCFSHDLLHRDSLIGRLSFVYSSSYHVCIS